MPSHHYPWLRPEDLRTFNREASRRDTYLVSEPWRAARDVLQQIANVPNRLIQAAIDAAGLQAFDLLVERHTFTADEALKVVAAPWERHMALHCGLHFWPDANHRTAVFGFNLALERHVGLHAKMVATTAELMLRESKAIRPTLHAQGQLTREALMEPRHPYRQLFGSYAGHLQVTDRIDERDTLFTAA